MRINVVTEVPTIVTKINTLVDSKCPVVLFNVIYLYVSRAGSEQMYS